MLVLLLCLPTGEVRAEKVHESEGSVDIHQKKMGEVQQEIKRSRAKLKLIRQQERLILDKLDQMEIELQPLLQKVRRKRIIRTAAYNRRNRLVLKLLEKYQNESFGDNNLRVVWGPVLPQDMAKLVVNEQAMVQSGIHSRRRAMDEVGVKDPDREFSRWLEERETILKMNKELNLRLTGAERE